MLLVALSCFIFYYRLRKAMWPCCFLMDLNSDNGSSLLLNSIVEAWALSMPLTINFNLFDAIVDSI